MASEKLKKTGLRKAIVDVLKNEKPIEVVIKLKFPSKRIIRQILTYILLIACYAMSAVFFSIAESIPVMVAAGLLVLAVQYFGWLAVIKQKPILHMNHDIDGILRLTRNVCAVAMSICCIVSILLALLFLLDIKAFMTVFAQYIPTYISLGVIILALLVGGAVFVFVSNRLYVLPAASLSFLCYNLRYTQTILHTIGGLNAIRRNISNNIIFSVSLLILSLLMYLLLTRKKDANY